MNIVMLNMLYYITKLIINNNSLFNSIEEKMLSLEKTSLLDERKREIVIAFINDMSYVKNNLIVFDNKNTNNAMINLIVEVIHYCLPVIHTQRKTTNFAPFCA